MNNYKFFMSPEPRENLGPISIEKDAILGEVKTRSVAIGMVRNAVKKKTVKLYLRPFPHIRIDKAKPLQGWYKGKNEPKAVRPRPCYTEAILTEPYGGFCPVGCIGCYVNSGIRGYRGTGVATVPIDYGEQIAKQLSTMYRATAGYITSFHDPFNVLEQYYHNSQRTAEAFTAVGLPIFFLSRLKYPDWAIALLKKNKHSYAQKSINTPNAEDWKKLSPGALPLPDQFKDIERLAKAGIYVSIQVNPVHYRY
jgi:DNA repair photolyase